MKVPTCLLPKSTCKIRLARTCKTVNDDVPWSINEASCGQQKYLVLIQVSVIVVDGVYVCIRIAKLGIARKALGSVVILTCIAVIDHKIKSLIERHRGILSYVKLLVIKGFYERLKAEFTQFAAGFITDHGDHLLRSSLLHGRKLLALQLLSDSPEAAFCLRALAQGYLDCCSVRP